MNLNTEKTQSETDVAIFEEITNHMSDFIVKTYATLIRQNLELFGMTEFITKRKDIINNSMQTDSNLSEDALKLGYCIDKLNILIKSKNLYAESGHLTLLSVAILLNDIKSVEKLLKQKIQFPHSEISFMFAIKAKNTDIIKLLLEQEYFQKMFNIFVEPKISFLYYALSEKKFDIASYLIQQQGAKLYPEECLHVLALKELYSHPELLNQVLSIFRSYYSKSNIPTLFQFAPDFQIVKLLHAHGMRLTEQFTPSFLKELHVTSSLKFAVYTGDTEFCAHLLETEEKPKSIQEELYLALFKSNTEILKILLDKCPASDYDPAILLKKILIHLPNAKQLELIPTLLGNEYFNYRLEFDDFVNLFEIARESCNFVIASLMLKSVYFSHHDLSLASKIFQSIQKIPTDQIENFCLAIKDIIHQPLANFDLFYYAIRSKHKMLVQGLINCGADNQIVYKNRMFPLLITLLCPSPDEEILRILLGFSTDEQIYYALNYCTQEKLNGNILSIIKVVGSEKLKNSLNKQLMIKAVLTNNSVALFYFLAIRKFEDNYEGLTLLDFAILLNNAKLITVCKDAGIKNNFVQDLADLVPSFCGHKISEIPSAYLALLRLCISSKPEDVEKLKKIDMSNLNSNYQLPDTLFTPLMLATLYQNEEAIKFLLKHNANPKMECRNELNATRIAVFSQNVKIVRLFAEVDNDLVVEDSAQDNSAQSSFLVKYKYTNKRKSEEISENNADNSPSGKKTCI